jgi:hypothetical protein
VAGTIGGGDEVVLARRLGDCLVVLRLARSWRERWLFSSCLRSAGPLWSNTLREGGVGVRDDRLVTEREPEGASWVLWGEILAIGNKAGSGAIGVVADGRGQAGTGGGVVEASLRRGKVTGLEGSM